MKKILFIFAAAALMCACADSKSDPALPGDSEWTSDIADGGITSEDGTPGEGGGGESGETGNEQGEAGRVTAGEWRDLDNWLFWSNLMTQQKADQEGNDYTGMSDYWKLYTNNRVAVRVTNEAGALQKDVPVQVVRINDGKQTVLYEARTDNKGETNLWIGLTQMQQEVDATNLALIVNGKQHGEPVAVTNWGEEVEWNTCIASVKALPNIDIAFIVDATGSMYDEIAFLKADLTNIIQTVGTKHTDATIRTAALFYRDEGDDYVTKVQDFSKDLSKTVNFISKQNADGGGDYPEAVHTALAVGLQKLSWREDNSIRLAFMLLDAPPHKNDQVIESLQKSIPQYAQRGIRIIPVAASGVDKNTEFFLRFTALATDATYVFITNDSGIGGEHIAATVGDYEVELLNELIVRLIDQYLQ